MSPRAHRASKQALVTTCCTPAHLLHHAVDLAAPVPIRFLDHVHEGHFHLHLWHRFLSLAPVSDALTNRSRQSTDSTDSRRYRVFRLEATRVADCSRTHRSRATRRDRRSPRLGTRVHTGCVLTQCTPGRPRHHTPCNAASRSTRPARRTRRREYRSARLALLLWNSLIDLGS